MTEPTPTARRTYIYLALIIVAGLVVRALLVPLISAPYPADAAYYLHVAQNLADGRGLVTDYAWIYARGVPDSLPMPAMGYWNPGMCLYLFGWLKILGSKYLSAQIANVFLSIPFGLIVWFVAREVTGSDAASLLAVGLASVEPYLVTWSITADATMLHATIVSGALLCILKGLRDRPVWMLVAGFLGGCAWLVRNDGVLVLAVLLLCVLLAARREWSRAKGRHVLLGVAGAAVVMLPWVLRNQLLFGSPSPPHQSALFFLADYVDIFRTDWSTITPGRWLDAHGGLGGVIKYDLVVLAKMLGWVVLGAGNVFLIFAVPFLAKRRPLVALPFVVQFVLLTIAYAFLLPEIGCRGASARSIPCIAPLLLAGAAGGLIGLAGWLAARLKPLSHALAATLLAALLLAHTTGRMAEWVGSRGVEVAERPYVANSDLLRGFFEAHPSTGVLTDDPWMLHRATGVASYQIPAGGIGEILALGAEIGAEHLVVHGGGLTNYDGLELSPAAVVRAFDTAERFGGLYIVDLHALSSAEESGALNAQAASTAQAGDYEAATTLFRTALDAVADESEAHRLVSENLAKALRDWSEELVTEGHATEASQRLEEAFEAAPPGALRNEIAEQLTSEPALAETE